MSRQSLTTKMTPLAVEVVKERPKAPDHLTDKQKAVWKTVVDRLPPDWFPAETHDMLALYCEHAVSVSKLGEMVNEYESYDASQLTDPETSKQYKLTLAMRKNESASMMQIATKLRMTLQSTRSAGKSKEVGNTAAKLPWEIEEEHENE